jgi:plastocyanin
LARLAVGAVALALAVPWLVRPDRPAAAAGHQVSIAHYAFGPGAMTVTAGDTVTWTNSDQASHDVATTSAPASFHSPLLATGQSWSVLLNAPGTYSYHCSVHPDMRARVVVLARPAAPVAPVAPPTQTHPHGSPAGQPPTTHARTPAAAPATGAGAGAGAPTSQGAAPARPAASPAAAGSQPTGGTLDPLLLVAGVVTAVAVFCLLVLASTPTRGA